MLEGRDGSLASGERIRVQESGVVFPEKGQAERSVEIPGERVRRIRTPAEIDRSEVVDDIAVGDDEDSVLAEDPEPASELHLLRKGIPGIDGEGEYRDVRVGKEVPKYSPSPVIQAAYDRFVVRIGNILPEELRSFRESGRRIPDIVELSGKPGEIMDGLGMLRHIHPLVRTIEMRTDAEYGTRDGKPGTETFKGRHIRVALYGFEGEHGRSVREEEYREPSHGKNAMR